MADSHGVEKSSAGSFRDRIREFASANRVMLLSWCAVLLVLLGFLAWASYAEAEDLVAATLGWVAMYMVVIVPLLVWDFYRFSKPEHKPVDDLKVEQLPAMQDVSPMSKNDYWEMIYPLGVLITGFVTFVVSWIYCIATYGFLFGVGLGWLPSIIVAVIAGYLWPLIVIAIVALIVLISK